MPTSVVTRKFALIPQGAPEERGRILNAVRRQFLKFRDLQNKYLHFLVNLIRENPSLIHNKPYEYPNFHLNLTKAHRAEFKELKAQGKIPATESLPSSSKARLRKYFYDYYSEPNDSTRNLSAFDTASFHSLTLIERAKQNALQYPFHAVRNWVIRNERIKTIGRCVIAFLNSKRHRTIYFRHGKRKLSVNESEYILQRLLSGKTFHDEFLSDISQHTAKNIFGERDAPSHEYLSNHVGQLRNLLLKKGTLDALMRKELRELLRDENTLESALRELFPTITASFKEKGAQTYILGLFIRRLRFQTTKLAKIRLERGIPLHGNSVEVRVVNELFSSHTIQTLEYFKHLRNSILTRAKIKNDPSYRMLSGQELLERVKRKVLDFLKGLLSNKDINTAKALLKPSFPAIYIPSLDTSGFFDYFATRIFYGLKERIFLLLSKLGIICRFKKRVVAELRAIIEGIYRTAVPHFRQLTVPLTVTEYMYDPPNGELRVRFGMEKGHGKAYTFFISQKNKRRFEKLYKPAFRRVRGKIKDNLRNPVLQLKGRKLILCQPFAVQTDTAPPASSFDQASDTKEGEKKIKLGVDLGLKHFAVLSVMATNASGQSRELRRYFLSQRTLYDMKFDDESGNFTFLRVKEHLRDGSVRVLQRRLHPTNIKMKLIRLRREHRHIQQLRAAYETRHPDEYRERLKWYHRSKTESCLWNKIQRINKDIINRLSGTITRIARFHGATTIRFEDLRWVRHHSKRQRGNFLAFWQTHWFHSQVQTMTAQHASRLGIRCVLVDAYKTSQNCAVCGREGIRASENTKLFHCPHCSSIVDADLNAARNIAKGTIIKALSVSSLG